jgi:hypothetical protein
MRLLSRTPATAALLLRASITFEGGEFVDERRLRERLQALGEAGMVRAWSTAHVGGGLKNYYKLTTLGWQILSGNDVVPYPRALFGEVPPSLFAHTFRLAEVIVETLRACHHRRVSVERFHRENDLVFQVGDKQVQPDCFLRLAAQGRVFNLAFEVDNATASLDSHVPSSIRSKLTVYHAYQEQVLSQWLAGGKRWERPRFRVVFLTPSAERASHILSLAADTSPHPRRRLVYAATFDAFVTDADPLFAPLFLDHFGHWHSLIDLHPAAPFRKPPVRLIRPMEMPLGVC